MSGSHSAPLRILMIHGYTQSGPLFRAKTRALEKKLLKAFPTGVSLVYPTAPIRLAPADVPGFSPLTSTAASGESHTGELNGDKHTADKRGSAEDSKSHGPSRSDPSKPQQAGSMLQTAAESEIDAYGWWRRRGDTEPYYYEGMELGLHTLARTLEEEGPFDGVIGFSQGGSAAGMIASLLEPGRKGAFEDAARLYGGIEAPEGFWTRRNRGAQGKEGEMATSQRTELRGEASKDHRNRACDIAQRSERKEMMVPTIEPSAGSLLDSSFDEGSSLKNHSNTNRSETFYKSKQDRNSDSDVYEPIHPPLKFAVSYSGYGTLNPLYAGFFNPRIRTPMLHFIGSLDTVVEERRSLMLVDACDDGGMDSSRRVVYHPGGHFLPSSQKQLVEALVGFIREAMTKAEQKEKHIKEEKAGLESFGSNEMQRLRLDNERNAHM